MSCGRHSVCVSWNASLNRRLIFSVAVSVSLLLSSHHRICLLSSFRFVCLFVCLLLSPVMMFSDRGFSPSPLSSVVSIFFLSVSPLTNTHQTPFSTPIHHVLITARSFHSLILRSRSRSLSLSVITSVFSYSSDSTRLFEVASCWLFVVFPRACAVVRPNEELLSVSRCPVSPSPLSLLAPNTTLSISQKIYLFKKHIPSHARLTHEFLLL